MGLSQLLIFLKNHFTEIYPCILCPVLPYFTMYIMIRKNWNVDLLIK